MDAYSVKSYRSRSEYTRFSGTLATSSIGEFGTDGSRPGDWGDSGSFGDWGDSGDSGALASETSGVEDFSESGRFLTVRRMR